MTIEKAGLVVLLIVICLRNIKCCTIFLSEDMLIQWQLDTLLSSWLFCLRDLHEQEWSIHSVLWQCCCSDGLLEPCTVSKVTHH